MLCSTTGSTSGCGERRVHAVRLPVDELPPHAGDQRAKYHPDVGYLPSTSPPPVFYLHVISLGMPGGGHRRILAISSVCMLCLPRAVEQKAARYGLSGDVPRPWYTLSSG